MAVEPFVLKTIELIEKEREAEIAETQILQDRVSPKELQRRGLCILKLRICTRSTGLYGRVVLMFEPFWPGKEMPSHNFSPGDIVGVSLSQGDSSQETLGSGIVSRVGQSSISVAFDETHDQLDLDDQTQYRLTKLANDVTYKRLKRAMKHLNDYGNGPSGNLINVLFGQAEISPPMSQAREGKAIKVELENASLNESQQEAVKFALHQRDLAIIHGPPGTGKTTTVVEIILQAVKNNMKVLACAPSNIAVDNLVERLAAARSRVVRLGHPARLLPHIQKYALDALVANSDEKQLVHDVRKDMDTALGKLRKARASGERQHLKQELKTLRRELRQREDAAVTSILLRAQVVLATLASSSPDGPLKLLEAGHFDLVIIDECSQALEAACWISLLQAPRCVLAGDHLQLPPTILSREAAKDGLEVTLIERQLHLHGDKAMRMLTTQYRMNEIIMHWPSQQLYEGKLTAHSSVATHLLRELDGVEDIEETRNPLFLIDTAGCDLTELNIPDEFSKGNEGEADLVAAHVERLVGSGLNPTEIAVIAPYNLQVELLRLRLHVKFPTLEIKSVDGFQGREKEAVVITLVRSNSKGEVGFLSEDRRINVAITRARRHLALICDSETVAHHPFLAALVQYMTEKGEVRSAHQYMEDAAFKGDYERPDYIAEQLDVPRSKSKTTSKRPSTTKQVGHQQKASTRKVENEPSTSSTNSKGPKVEHDEQDDIRREESLRKQLTAFMMDDSRMQLAFPATLNSFERRLVHEISENLGVQHLSEGIGPERHIVVTKTIQAPSNTTSPANSLANNRKEKRTVTPSIPQCSDRLKTTKTEDKRQGIQQQAGIKDGNKVDKQDQAKDTKMMFMTFVTNKLCSICSKDIPVANYDLHQIRCSKNSQKATAGADVRPKDLPTKPEQLSKSATKKNKKKKSDKKEEVEEDFDTLIEAAIKDNKSCHYPKCKSNTALLGMNCEFCTRRFCLTHHIAEAHGCGDAVRQHARAVINKEGVLYRGSGVPSKKMDPIKRGHLERRLDKKLDSLSSKRKTKQNES